MDSSCNVDVLTKDEGATMEFLKERIGSVISKKVAAAGIGLTVVETWPQAAVIIAYLLGQAWVDAHK